MIRACGTTGSADERIKSSASVTGENEYLPSVNGDYAGFAVKASWKRKNHCIMALPLKRCIDIVSDQAKQAATTPLITCDWYTFTATNRYTQV